MTDLTCELCGDNGPMMLHARCHLSAPLSAELKEGWLILRCYLPECNREVVRLKLETPDNTAQYHHMRDVLVLADRAMHNLAGNSFIESVKEEIKIVLRAVNGGL